MLSLQIHQNGLQIRESYELLKQILPKMISQGIFSRPFANPQFWMMHALFISSGSDQAESFQNLSVNSTVSFHYEKQSNLEISQQTLISSHQSQWMTEILRQEKLRLYIFDQMLKNSNLIEDVWKQNQDQGFKNQKLFSQIFEENLDIYDAKANKKQFFEDNYRPEIIQIRGFFRSKNISMIKLLTDLRAVAKTLNNSIIENQMKQILKQVTQRSKLGSLQNDQKIQLQDQENNHQNQENLIDQEQNPSKITRSVIKKGKLRLSDDKSHYYIDLTFDLTKDSQ